MASNFSSKKVLRTSPVERDDLDDPRVFTLFSDFCGAASGNASQTGRGQFPEFVGTAAITYNDTYYPFGVAGVATITVSTAGTRSWIQDRPAAGNGELIMGIRKMSVEARVRFVQNPELSTEGRVGFFPGHNDPDNLAFGCAFTCYGKTTWSAWNGRFYNNVFATQNNSMLDGQLISYRDKVETGISAADWHTLKVEIDAGATVARWSIDGRVVYEQTSPYLASYEYMKRAWIQTQIDAGVQPSLFPKTDLDFVDTFRTNNLLVGAGISARSDSTVMTGNATLECDWLLYKYYR